MSALARMAPEQAAWPATRAAARPQCKARLGPVNDPLEREADRVADSVLRGENASVRAATPATVQAKCAQCEDEDRPIQRTCSTCGAAHAGAAQAEGAVAGGGEALSASARAYFEPRFGRDLSHVRVHADSAAGSAAGAIGARAYTLGSSIAFAPGEYAPDAPEGRRLIAHELAHVAQQRGGGGAGTIRRAVAASSRCPANVHGAPADPMAEIAAADARAERMALGVSNVLALEALTFTDPTFGRSYVSDAYERRFGLPPAATRGRFRNRFTGTLHPTRDEAMRGEMLSLSDRFRTLSTFLGGAIRYVCPGTARFTLPGCSAIACGGALAFSCPGGRQIDLCPTFWTFPLMQSADQRGGNMIHEAVHMRLRFAPHNLGTANQRGQNSECHAAIVGDIYNFQSDDTFDCTPLIP